MICPICHQLGVSSKVFDQGSTSTLVAYIGAEFYDGQGKFHNHDDNCTIRYYRCSGGHHFSERRQNQCWCGWKGKEECFCHPLGVKVRAEAEDTSGGHS